MCGGNKGQSQQQSTYTPNPAATGAIQGAIQNAQNVASTPFQQPVAPVAGFSQDQLSAFQNVNNAQGMANPFVQQAQNFYGQSATPNISQFFNPFAGAVTSQLNNIFGQQASQNTGQLTQAAGGVGADRIAVGQGNLANQQGLAAGQTLAGLYQPALGAAQQEQSLQQGLGTNYANLGYGAQNAALQGAQAQLGTGGLQQQLSQAQLNAPYQQQLAQLAYPFQVSNFLSGTIGALAPGLGGTTYGTNQAAPPNMYSQLAGAGVAGLGLYNGFSGGNSGASGGWYGPSSVGGAPLGQARGGVVNNPFAFDEGGTVSDEPIDSAPASIVPNMPLHAIAAHIPQLASQSGSASSGGPSLGDIAKMGLQIGMMFANRGGAVRNPFAFTDGGDTTMEDRFDPVKQAIASGAFDPQGINSTTFEGSPAMVAANNGFVPMPQARPGGAPAMADDDAELPDAAAPAQGVNNFSQLPQSPTRDPGFAGSPWAALTAAGLGMMGGTSPYFGVNIGQGGLQGLKTLEAQRAASQKDETIAQAAEKLHQEAQAHLDSMTKTTPYQQGLLDVANKKLAKDEGDTTARDIVDGMEKGDLPPTTTGLYGKGAAVRAEAARRGFNLTQAGLQYGAAQKQVAVLNGPQTTRLMGLSKSVDNTIDEVTTLGEQLHNSGIPLLNHAKLVALIQTEGNSPRGQLATRYLTAVNTVKEEFANAANGGYAPTDAAWHLANEQINGDYGEQQLKASLGEVQRLIRYRINAIPNINTLGPTSANRYTGATGAPAGGAAGPQFTGRTATNKSSGQRLRETSDGQWVP